MKLGFSLIFHLPHCSFFHIISSLNCTFTYVLTYDYNTVGGPLTKVRSFPCVIKILPEDTSRHAWYNKNVHDLDQMWSKMGKIRRFCCNETIQSFCLARKARKKWKQVLIYAVQLLMLAEDWADYSVAYVRISADVSLVDACITQSIAVLWICEFSDEMNKFNGKCISRSNYGSFFWKEKFPLLLQW